MQKQKQRKTVVRIKDFQDPDLVGVLAVFVRKVGNGLQVKFEMHGSEECRAQLLLLLSGQAIMAASENLVQEPGSCNTR